MRFPHRASPIALGLLLLGLSLIGPAQSAPASGLQNGQDEAPAERQFNVTAKRYTFEPARIEVNQGDVIKITLKTADIPHSFTIDAYRIAKRVSPGHPITFEFRADQAGTFPYYCNLTIEEGCKKMKGELVVKPRK
ncbi:MAG: cupredoxin domain-containing protein [Acidobacteriota bacterium]|nr:cupredoxin domain-containing protein [Acidobacteriota bacterium]